MYLRTRLTQVSGSGGFTVGGGGLPTEATAGRDWACASSPLGTVKAPSRTSRTRGLKGRQALGTMGQRLFKGPVASGGTSVRVRGGHRGCAAAAPAGTSAQCQVPRVGRGPFSPDGDRVSPGEGPLSDTRRLLGNPCPPGAFPGSLLVRPPPPPRSISSVREA